VIRTELSLGEFSEIQDMIFVDTPHKLSHELPGGHDIGQPFLDANVNLEDCQRDVNEGMLPQHRCGQKGHHRRQSLKFVFKSVNGGEEPIPEPVADGPEVLEDGIPEDCYKYGVAIRLGALDLSELNL
jgi:hypothetical protein